MKSIIFKLICEFSDEDGMKFYSEGSIDSLITYLENLTKSERGIMAKEFKTTTNEIHKFIVPKTDTHKKCNTRIAKLEKENIELRKVNIELRKENFQLRKELDELKLMFLEHLKVCKSIKQ